MNTRTIALWVLATALGEALGATASALFGVVATAQLQPSMDPALSRGLIAMGGLLEGACLGGMQGWALQRMKLGPSARRWTLQTAVAMAAGWSIAAAAGELLPLEGLGLSQAGIVLGAVLGMVVGAGQAVGTRHQPRFLPWVIGSTLAFAVGLPVASLGHALLPAVLGSDSSLTAKLLHVALAGVASGACLGALSVSGFGFSGHPSR